MLLSSSCTSLYNISIIVSGFNGIAIVIAIAVAIAAATAATAATVTAEGAAIFCHDTQEVRGNEYSQRNGCQRDQ